MIELSRREILLGLGAVATTTLLPSGAVLAQPNKKTPKYVQPAYRVYAEKHAVPPELLFALAHKESNDPRRNMPCPYAMNVRGKSLYFDDQDSLYSKAKSLVEQGITSFDMGPIQVNWHWHMEKFEDLFDASNPYRNLDVGTAYLREMYEKYDNWFIAGGKYHSPGSKPEQQRRARNYTRDLIRIYKELGYS